MKKKNYRHFNLLGGLMVFGTLVLNPVFMGVFVPQFPLLKGLADLLWCMDTFFFLTGFIFLLIPRISAGWLLSVISIFIILFLFEIALIINPEILGIQFANHVLSKYHAHECGIYFHHVPPGINWMKPNAEANMYYNGYHWHHRTDKHGFRNDKDMEQADILLIGDSFIYGHGVEYENTVGYYLEKKSGRSVFNMARQGDFTFPQMYLLKKFGLELKPEYVFYFFFHNDLSDLSSLGEERINEFLGLSSESLNYPPIPDDLETKKPIVDCVRFKQKGLMLFQWLEFLQKLKEKKKKKKIKEKIKKKKLNYKQGNLSKFQRLNIIKYDYFKGEKGIMRKKQMAFFE